MLSRCDRLALLVLACAACSRSSSQPSPAPAAEPAPVAVPAESPGLAGAAAVEPPPPEAAVREATEVPPGDGASAVPLSPDRETVVDPASRFRVVLAGMSRDGRLLLLDAAGAAVPAVESSEVGATTVLTLAPSAALTPGSRYQLRVDGAIGRELHLGERGYPPCRYTLRAAGDPAPPAAKAPHKKRGHRR